MLCWDRPVCACPSPVYGELPLRGGSFPPSPLLSTDLIVLDQLNFFFFFPSVKSMEGVYRGLSETNTSLQKLLPMSDSASESGSPVGVQDRKQLLISTQNGISIVNFVHTHNKLTFTQLNILWNVRVHVKYADGNYGRFKNLKNWGINTTLIVSVWKTMWSYCFTTK